ncbi:MAG: hypothetical protein FWG82_07150 [Oscillospiraceae bacterium]|nr:hypothetical protein [Oscillospiraceae bacterium]
MVTFLHKQKSNPAEQQTKKNKTQATQQSNAYRRLEIIMSDVLTFNPPPNKADDGLKWAAHMAEIHRIAEKMMLDEVMYTKPRKRKRDSLRSAGRRKPLMQ